VLFVIAEISDLGSIAALRVKSAAIGLAEQRARSREQAAGWPATSVLAMFRQTEN
jgi:hypothetical protein